MNSKNDYIRDFLGVTAWHKAGYTGTRGLTASGENFAAVEHSTDHALETYDAFHEIAPDRKVVYLNFRDVDNLVKETDAQGIDTMFVSLSSQAFQSNLRKQIDEELPKHTTIFVAAGNYDDERYNYYMKPERVYGVGAVRIIGPTTSGQYYVDAMSYTSESELVDFAGVTNFKLDGNRSLGGTSCATPVLCGMAALVNDFFIDKAGVPLTDEAMYRFLKDHTMDVEATGKDIETGWGLPILPHPDTIDIFKYAETPKVSVRVEVSESVDVENQNFKIQKMLSPNRRVKADRKIEYIVIHYFGSLGTAESVANYFCTSGLQSSAHYVVDEGKIVYNVVPDGDVAWHCGGNGVGTLKNICTNDNSIGIEVRPSIMNESYANDASYRGWYFEKAVEDRLVEVVKWLMNKHNIDVDHVVRHYETTAKSCPRPFVGNDINLYYGTTGNEQWERFKARLEEDDEMLTYEQFKAYMERYEEERDNLAGSNWSQVERDWANAQGIINGDANGKMRWKAPITREEYAVTEYRQSRKK